MSRKKNRDTKDDENGVVSIPNPQFNWGGLLSRLVRAKTDGNESLYLFFLCLRVFVVRKYLHMKHTCPENKSGHKVALKFKHSQAGAWE